MPVCSKNLFVVIVVVILFTVAALAGALLMAGQLSLKYYKLYLQTRLDPIGQKHQVNAPLPEGPLLAVFGDSRAAAWPASHFPGWNVLNGGVSGQTSAQCALRLPSLLTQWQPQKVVVQLGINDLKAIGVFPEKKAAIVADLRENLSAIGQSLAQQNISYLITTVLPDSGRPGLVRGWIWPRQIEEAREEINRWIMQHNWPGEGRVVDLDPFLPAPRTAFYLDFLHLNPKGYSALPEFPAEVVSGKDPF